jgi:kynureninase
VRGQVRVGLLRCVRGVRFQRPWPKFEDPQARGCQISTLTDHRGKALFDFLAENGVIADWREPNVIRFAPVPMYNSFEDVYQLGQAIRNFS